MLVIINSLLVFWISQQICQICHSCLITMSTNNDYVSGSWIIYQSKPWCTKESILKLYTPNSFFLFHFKTIWPPPPTEVPSILTEQRPVVQVITCNNMYGIHYGYIEIMLFNPLSSEGDFCRQSTNLRYVHICLELAILIKMDIHNPSWQSVVLESSVKSIGSQSL